MKKLIIIMAVVLSVFTLFGCNSSGGGGGKKSGNKTGVSTGSSGGGSGSGGGAAVIQTKEFWAHNMVTNAPYKFKADLLGSTQHCEVWVQQSSGVTAATAQNLANVYQGTIRPRMITNFGLTLNYNSSNYPTMDFADLYLGNEDGKLCILLLDIIDGYSYPGPYIAGYFYAYHCFEAANSNNTDMIFIDTNPGLQNDVLIKQAYNTIAHEMQHLMNFASTVAIRSNMAGSQIIELNEMDLWINEGLSSAAEWAYLQNHSNGRLEDFNDDDTGLIAQGNNFFLWGNREGTGEGKHVNAVLDDYSSVYLFFQWLRIQSGSTKIYKDIISSVKSNYTAVTGAASANSLAYTSNKAGLGSMLRDWHAANYINYNPNLNSNPYPNLVRYGYRNEPGLRRTTSGGNPITVHYVPAGKTSISLFPGEGVFSAANGNNVPVASGNIRYSGLKTNAVPVTTGSFTGALLTYNIDDNSDIDSAVSASGTTTGVAANIQASGNKSVQIAQTNKIFPISFSDMLRRNGHAASDDLIFPLYHESLDEW